jgi:imidazolonepropionase-like amidohydrolase
MTKKLIFMALVSACQCLQAATYIQCERLIDGRSNTTFQNQTIKVEDSTIVDILVGYQTGKATDQVVTLADATCMPGLIDMHVHITSELHPNRQLDSYRLDPQDFALASVPYARKTLMAGFTTVRDLGSSNNLAISLRNAINKGLITGPRIYSAG